MGLLIALASQHMGCGGNEAASHPDGSAPHRDASTIDGDDGSRSVCPLMDEAPAHSVTVVVRNERAQTIYVAERDCAAIFEVKATDTTIPGKYPAPYPARGATVVPHCSFPSRECTAFHLCHQQGYFAIEIRSGEELAVAWPGTLHPIVDVPVECRFDAGLWKCDQCIATRAARPAEYVVQAEAWSEVPECPAPGTCPCQRFSDGTCRHRFTAVPPRELAAATSFGFPASDSVEVVFR